ncbi:hypothetical protein Sinac_6790 [Singulisphaera acidiphila DSM 18658]|uniref:Uncharacterized protein n=1 Tax=Singulisphaera acidiphila (strain ATCC BAA-1392 / DSM 18658 / VKM B-2454 / MOB10) TaxID=886293 RepID=L0DR24_SINAD|nr:hypothetical protein Sinac_6790 [Singulisphaera acidiphila DSM 18658]
MWPLPFHPAHRDPETSPSTKSRRDIAFNCGFLLVRPTADHERKADCIECDYSAACTFCVQLVNLSTLFSSGTPGAIVLSRPSKCWTPWMINEPARVCDTGWSKFSKKMSITFLEISLKPPGWCSRHVLDFGLAELLSDARASKATSASISAVAPRKRTESLQKLAVGQAGVGPKPEERLQGPQSSTRSTARHGFPSPLFCRRLRRVSLTLPCTIVGRSLQISSTTPTESLSGGPHLRGI